MIRKPVYILGVGGTYLLPEELVLALQLAYSRTNLVLCFKAKLLQMSMELNVLLGDLRLHLHVSQRRGHSGGGGRTTCVCCSDRVSSVSRSFNTDVSSAATCT